MKSEQIVNGYRLVTTETEDRRGKKRRHIEVTKAPTTTVAAPVEAEREHPAGRRSKPRE